MLKLLRNKKMNLKEKFNALRTYIEVRQGKAKYYCPFNKKYSNCPYVGKGDDRGICYHKKPWHCEYEDEYEEEE